MASPPTEKRPSPLKRRDDHHPFARNVKAFLIGGIIGFILAALLLKREPSIKLGLLEPQKQQAQGTLTLLAADVGLYQNEARIGVLQAGTLLLHRERVGNFERFALYINTEEQERFVPKQDEQLPFALMQTETERAERDISITPTLLKTPIDGQTDVIASPDSQYRSADAFSSSKEDAEQTPSAITPTPSPSPTIIIGYLPTALAATLESAIMFVQTPAAASLSEQAGNKALSNENASFTPEAEPTPDATLTPILTPSPTLTPTPTPTPTPSETSLVLDKISARQGETVTFKLMLSKGQIPCKGVAAGIAFPPGVTVKKVAAGGLLSNGFVIDSYLPSANIIRVVADSNTDTFSGDGVLFLITVEISANAPVGTFPVRLFTFALSDAESKRVESGHINGTMQIAEMPRTPTPTPTVQPTAPINVTTPTVAPSSTKTPRIATVQPVRTITPTIAANPTATPRPTNLPTATPKPTATPTPQPI